LRDIRADTFKVESVKGSVCTVIYEFIFILKVFEMS